MSQPHLKAILAVATVEGGGGWCATLFDGDLRVASITGMMDGVEVDIYESASTAIVNALNGPGTIDILIAEGVHGTQVNEYIIAGARSARSGLILHSIGGFDPETQAAADAIIEAQRQAGLFLRSTS